MGGGGGGQEKQGKPTAIILDQDKEGMNKGSDIKNVEIGSSKIDWVGVWLDLNKGIILA